MRILVIIYPSVVVYVRKSSTLLNACSRRTFDLTHLDVLDYIQTRHDEQISLTAVRMGNFPTKLDISTKLEGVRMVDVQIALREKYALSLTMSDII